MNREVNQLEVTKVDARKLKPEAQYEKRKQVIQLYKRGLSLRQIVTEQVPMSWAGPFILYVLPTFLLIAFFVFFILPRFRDPPHGAADST